MKLPDTQKRAPRVKCALDACPVLFAPKRPWQVYHQSGCRLKAWRQKHPELTAGLVRDYGELKKRVAHLERKAGVQSKAPASVRERGKQATPVPARGT